MPKFDNLNDAAKAVEDLRTSILFDDDNNLAAGLGPLSEQDYLLALNALEQAQRLFARAAIVLAFEIATARKEY